MVGKHCPVKEMHENATNFSLSVFNNIQRLATGIDFDRADASIEIVFAAAAACQEILRL